MHNPKLRGRLQPRGKLTEAENKERVHGGRIKEVPHLKLKTETLEQTKLHTLPHLYIQALEL
jgi:hypothetical protein